MSGSATYFKVGIFVLTAAALATAGVVILGAKSILLETVLWETYLDESVQGLDEGAPVKYRGVSIGSVKSIDFVENVYGKHGHLVLITCSFRPGSLGGMTTEETIEPRLRKEIKEGLRVSLSSAGLTGGMYLEVDYFEPEKHPPMEIDWTPATYYIPSVPSTRVRLMDAVNEVMDDLRQAEIAGLAARLGTLIEDIAKVLKEDLVPAIQSIKATGDQAPKTLEAIETAVRVTLRTDMKAVLNDVGRFAKADLAPAARDIRVAAEDLPAAIKGLREVTEALPATLDRLNRTAKRIDLMAAGREGDLEETFENLRVIMDDLRRITGRATKHSSQLLFGEAPPAVKRGR